MYPLNWPLHDQYMTSGFKVTVPSILPVFECCKLGYREWLTAKSKKDSTPVRHIYSITVEVRTQREHPRWRHQETTAGKVGVSRFPFRAVQSRWSRHSSQWSVSMNSWGTQDVWRSDTDTRSTSRQQSLSWDNKINLNHWEIICSIRLTSTCILLNSEQRIPSIYSMIIAMKITKIIILT